MLQLTQISKSYGSTRVLASVDIHIHRSDMLCLSGPSGIGKSTVLTIASGLEKPDTGQVETRCSRLGVAFQMPIFLPWKSVKGNLEFVLSGADGRAAPDSREQVRFWLEKLGLDRVAGKKPEDLSGGMKKRLGLATSLVTRPELLLLDEPFSFLDREWQFRIVDALLHLNRTRGLTVFMASHELEPVRRLGAEILAVSDSPLLIRHLPGEQRCA